MIPKGFEWVSAEKIIGDVASVGFNSIRMSVIQIHGIPYYSRLAWL